MKTRRIYATPNLAAAHAALAAARDTGIEPDSLSLIARSDIEMDAVPDELREAHTDIVPAALRGAAGGGAVGLVAGLVAVAVPPLGITLAGAGVMAAVGALVGSWSSALVGASVPDPVRRQFEETIETGQILLVIDAEDDALHRAEAAVLRAGASPLPYEAATAVS
ncbi:hypothetical protein [Pseudoxanthomonas daejeonensis]|uniref:DUF1269 domain-containing protein n=1 Tax=Pseudoxanthomonas daejeonensis TaxID=266062 RepID=A0ABQ6ZBM3_9GAMM|nr:hypothetical protein [Pseudoxanthomonas daejeonensis]KAF1697051.1 hypothetical protein CSC65_03195 [Pseudoxanthomonas daejeonensis]